MKFGIKIWSTNIELLKLVKKHKEHFDYVELSAIVNSYDEQIIELLEGIPCIIHCDNKDVNLAQKLEKNKLALKECIKYADSLNSEHIIIHPGHKGEIDILNEYIKIDSRFCVENMPGITYNTHEEMMGRTYEEIKKINIKTFCLDYAHAIKASNTLNIDSNLLINNLIKLNPVIMHISDGTNKSEIDEHLSIGEGNFDFEAVKKIVKKYPDILITLETPKNSMNNLESDLENINNLKKIIT